MSTTTIELTAGELASVERVLARLSSGTQTDARDCTTDELLSAAQLMLDVRRARARFLHRSMLGEAAYDMLLALYTKPEDEAMTGARLSELSGVTRSSAIQWLDYLVGQGLVSRKPHPTDKRASLFALTESGRGALDQVARELCDGLRTFNKIV